MTPGEPLLALVMIARDEAGTIARALKSARPFVDEMVVLDTGSVDGTAEIARECGARVEKFTWSEDFAAAKNAALALTRARSRLVLDADEWLVRGGEDLRRWALATHDRFGVIECTSTFDDGAQSVTDRLTRVLPRGAHFEGRIHEQARGDFGADLVPLRVHHDGYEKSALARKAGRNEPMLRSALEENPQDGYLWHQLGVCLSTYERFAEATDAFAAADEFLEELSPQRHDLVVRHLHALGKSGRHDDAMRYYRAALPQWSGSPDLHFVMADVLIDLGTTSPHRAAAVTPVIRALLERCIAIGERPDLPGAVAGRGSWSAQLNLTLMSGPGDPGPSKARRKEKAS